MIINRIGSVGSDRYVDGVWEDFYEWDFLVLDCIDFAWLSFQPEKGQDDGT